MDVTDLDFYIYRKLQSQLDRLPIGFPKTDSGVDIKILKRFFTPKQAEIANYLSFMPETLSRIYIRVKVSHLPSHSYLKNITLKELRDELNDLGNKGSIISKYYLNKKLITYRLSMLALGIYEFQANRLTKEFVEDLDKYWDEEFGNDMWCTKENQLRVIPIEETIDASQNVFSYDSLKKLIKKAHLIGITSCVCRDGMDLKGNPCKVTELRESCFVFNQVAQYYVTHNLARRISREDAISILKKSQEAGLVIQPGNTKRPRFICTCCGCCCEVIRHVKKYPKPVDYYVSNYYAQVNLDLCKGCGLCAKKCQLEAIKMDNKKAKIDLNRCIGCGVCVHNCNHNAIQLIKKRKKQTPPRSLLALNMRILRKKKGFLYVLKLWIKFLLCMKV